MTNEYSARITFRNGRVKAFSYVRLTTTPEILAFTTETDVITIHVDDIEAMEIKLVPEIMAREQKAARKAA